MCKIASFHGNRIGVEHQYQRFVELESPIAISFIYIDDYTSFCDYTVRNAKKPIWPCTCNIKNEYESLLLLLKNCLHFQKSIRKRCEWNLMPATNCMNTIISLTVQYFTYVWIMKITSRISLSWFIICVHIFPPQKKKILLWHQSRLIILRTPTVMAT